MNTKICTNCKTEQPITEFYYNSNKKQYEWHCKTCGKVRSREWRKNNPERAKSSCISSRLKLKRENPPAYRILKLMASMRSRYSNKEVVKDITSHDLMELYNKQNGKCYYTGIQMKLLSDTERDLFLMSIDRTDSSKGYTNDNVVLCCWGINVLKGQHSEKDLFMALTSFYEGAKSSGKF